MNNNDSNNNIFNGQHNGGINNSTTPQSHQNTISQTNTQQPENPAMTSVQMPVNAVSTMNQSINDEELLKAFTGNNYDKITTRDLNFAGLFFTTFYMFYRKMFLFSLLTFLANLVVQNFIDNFSVTLVFNLLIGLLVNKIYLFYAKNKIKKIKLKNSQKSPNEIKEICSKEGGTSIGRIFLGLILEIIIAIIVFMIMTFMGVSVTFGSQLFDLIKNADSNIPSNETNNTNVENITFDGSFSYNTSINIADKFSISVPSNFEEGFFSDDNHYDYEYSSDYGVFDSCNVSLAQVNGYTSAENLINQIATYYDSNNVSEVTEVQINNVNWYYFSRSDDIGTIYYYGTTKNNKVFLLKYEIEEDAPSDCGSYKDEIINSVKAK